MRHVSPCVKLSLRFRTVDSLGVSWCTVWKGTPQDCMDDVRGAHDAPVDVKSTSLDRFFPPWTVRRQIWTDALRPCHSGISTDVLLFSEIHLSLVHHYRGFRQGLPHFTFRGDYMERLRVFVLHVSALQQCTLPFPAPGSFFLGSTFVLGGGSVASEYLCITYQLGLGRVASIYHGSGTVRRKCYQMLLLSYVILWRVHALPGRCQSGCV